MARPRKPTELLKASGAFIANPERLAARDGEPIVTDPLGAPPEHLNPHEIQVWREIEAMIPARVATAADALALECLVKLTLQIRTEEKPTAALFAQALTYMGRFGLTPADRAKMTVPKEQDEVNPWADLVDTSH